MRVLDVFSGVGLMSLGLGWAGMRTVGFCEIEPACRFWLREQWPTVPIFEDVRSLTGEVVLERCGAVDLLAGGFPCQPVSVAGARRGTEDARWLWPEMFRLVRELRPRWVLAENVPGLRTLGADGVLADLDSAGYSCWPLVVGADDVGAPHRRKRVWIVAHAGRGGQQRARADRGESDAGSDGRDLAAGGGARVGHAAGEPARREHDAARESDAARAGARVADPDREARPSEHEPGRAPSIAADLGRGLGDPDDARLALGTGERGDAREECPAAVRAGDPTLVRGVVARPGERQREWEAPRLADAERGARGDGLPVGIEPGHVPADAEGCGPGRGADTPRLDEAEATREPESRLGGSTAGSARRLARYRSAARRARLRAWGNGVYAPLVAHIGRAIAAQELSA